MSNTVCCPACGRLVSPNPDDGTGVPCPQCGATIPLRWQGSTPTVDQTVSQPRKPAPAAPKPRVEPAPNPSCQGIMIDGRYEVTAELGRGAFGVVYRASDQKLPRTVAIKMLSRDALSNAEAVRRFQEEARILCQVNHPHVLPVFDQGVHDGQHYIVFAFIEGKTLKEMIPPTGFADPGRACRLVAKLASALHFVHARHKILHRDVKPANVMLQDGDEDALYLMDFGLAVCHQEDVTRVTVDGTVMGTPAYMPPEQAKGKIAEVSHRSDVYSAAAVLFHLLTGKVPFRSPWPALVIDIITAPAPAPSSLRPGLDPGLDAIVLKGLEKNPDDRYQTGKEFAEALEDWVAGSRVAVPVGAGAGSGKLPRPPAGKPGRGGKDDKPLDLPEDLPEDLPPPPNSAHSSITGGSTLRNPPEPTAKAAPKPAPKPTAAEPGSPWPQPGNVPPPAKAPAPVAPARPAPPPKPVAAPPGGNKVVVRPLPPSPPAPPVRQPVHRAPAPPEPPPAAPAPRKSRSLVLSLLLALGALGILAGGVAALVYAISSGSGGSATKRDDGGGGGSGGGKAWKRD